MVQEPKPLRVYAPGREFIIPYIAREMPDCAVEAVSDVAVCDVAVVEPSYSLAGLPEGTTVLVCPNIVGTGMTGLPMELARRIARGSFYHLEGNEARLSTIHAADVAKAVHLSHGNGGRYLVTDGADPAFRDFAEALAWRLNHKRILTLSSRWVRWIISPALRRIITKDATVRADGTALRSFADEFDFHPVPVTEYLRTHVYDEKSL